MKSILHYLYIGICLSGIQTTSIWIAWGKFESYPLWQIFIVLAVAYAVMFLILDKIFGKP